MAAPADPSDLTWKGVPHSLGQVTNHLSHYFGLYSKGTPESWDNGQLRWIPYSEGQPRHFGGLSVFSSGGSLVTKVEASGFPGGDPPGLPRPPGGCPPGPSGSHSGGPPGPPGPPGGCPLGPPGDMGPQGPLIQSFIWQIS